MNSSHDSLLSDQPFLVALTQQCRDGDGSHAEDDAMALGDLSGLSQHGVLR
jgi:hypothetical protein